MIFTKDQKINIIGIISASAPVFIWTPSPPRPQSASLSEGDENGEAKKRRVRLDVGLRNKIGIFCTCVSGKPVNYLMQWIW